MEEVQPSPFDEYLDAMQRGVFKEAPERPQQMDAEECSGEVVQEAADAPVLVGAPGTPKDAGAWVDGKRKPVTTPIPLFKKKASSFIMRNLSTVDTNLAESIRSEAKQYVKVQPNGLPLFEFNVTEVHFSLPADLHPDRTSKRLTKENSKFILSELTNHGAIQILSDTKPPLINWCTKPLWLSFPPNKTQEWTPLPDDIVGAVEAAFLSGAEQVTANEFKIDLAKRIITSPQGDARQLERIVSPKLYPLAMVSTASTSLYNAASLALWGIHDKENIFALLISHTLFTTTTEVFKHIKARWQISRSGNPTDEDFVDACTTVDNDPPLHLFVLANIIRRPIIVYGEGHVSGIYLPLLWADTNDGKGEPTKPQMNPILFTCIQNEDEEYCFFPLVTFQDTSSLFVPLCNSAGIVLHVHFRKHNEYQMALLTKYTRYMEASVQHVSVPFSPEMVFGARLNLPEMPNQLIDLIELFQKPFLNKGPFAAAAAPAAPVPAALAAPVAPVAAPAVAPRAAPPALAAAREPAAPAVEKAAPAPAAPVPGPGAPVPRGALRKRVTFAEPHNLVLAAEASFHQAMQAVRLVSTAVADSAAPVFYSALSTLPSRPGAMDVDASEAVPEAPQVRAPSREQQAAPALPPQAKIARDNSAAPKDEEEAKPTHQLSAYISLDKYFPK